ncbi:hypothetical protein AAZX31_19G199600 [Glycine max]
MERPLGLQILTTPLDGITSMLEQGYCSLSFRNFLFGRCKPCMTTRVTRTILSVLLSLAPLLPNSAQVVFYSRWVIATCNTSLPPPSYSLAYAKYLTKAHVVVNCGGSIVTPKRLRAIAKKQVDYLLGDNPLKMSYMVGYGPRYPQRIHNRGSSLPSVSVHPGKIQCSAGFSVMKSQSPNPNILVGAVVGGPDLHDGFPDERSDYEQSEPATYINAPLVGALAYLAHSFAQL